MLFDFKFLCLECNACEVDTTSCSPCQEMVVTYDVCGCKHVSCIPRDTCLSGGVLHPVSTQRIIFACNQNVLVTYLMSFWLTDFLYK